MNYRHSYHAGNFADVLKHTVLITLIKKLQQKETPCFYLDTHAGRGQYDLHALEAKKTEESENGILRVASIASPPLIVKEYLNRVLALNHHKEIQFYPGSPLLIQNLMRQQDRFIASELHPEEVIALKQLLIQDKRIAVHQQDGYLAMKAFLPPKENRGLVLVDPPFEKVDEFAVLIESLHLALRKWSNGVYMVWYPIKDNMEVENFYRNLEALKSSSILNIQLHLSKKNEKKLTKNGLVIINPPWKVEEEFRVLLSWLSQALANGEKGTFLLEWIKEEGSE